MSAEISPIEKITSLIDQLDSTGVPRRSHTLFRNVSREELINDASEETEYSLEEILEDYSYPDTIERVDFRNFRSGSIRDIVAVDSGIIRLGETENGLFIALRGSIVIDHEDTCQAFLYRTGPVFLSYEHKVDLLFRLGQDLLKPDLFVYVDNEDPDLLRPTEIKRGAADNAHQYADRFRNWFERMLQLIAINRMENGIILLDGALTLRTRDTPSNFIHHLGDLANTNTNSIIGISKQSQIQIENKPIQFWLDEYPFQSGYRCLSSLMRNSRRDRILGNLYAVRFTPAGHTFRMDVKPVSGQSDDEAIYSFYSCCLMKSGYPDILVRAHAHSYFASAEVILFQAWIRANHEIIPKIRVDLGPPFAPFSGRFK